VQVLLVLSSATNLSSSTTLVMIFVTLFICAPARYLNNA
jgi:hypothetical protein